ncbi:MAG TPA: hypothetical protein VME18_04380 [Acidobacteriaceae bacterium]|nr:hypothetical protein [Acidobacteriaceae bacterium]
MSLKTAALRIFILCALCFTCSFGLALRQGEFPNAFTFRFVGPETRS